jgi:hypothetical protein
MAVGFAVIIVVVALLAVVLTVRGRGRR